ncbi:YetF domain-containing protein [Palleronia sp.]|uniref:YetF domain-containing protein n=1 Tax=Palleronia sp. TaxID=1940284 RepID=UPI0035C7B3FF
MLTASPTLLFYRGDFERAEMRRERVTEDEITGAVRQSGFGSFQDVEAIILEADGNLAVIGAAEAGDASALPDGSR